MEAYAHADVALCEAVIAGDRVVNELERQIDGKAVYLLATEQPTAVDLRFILAVLRMNVNLERVGDQAVHIARLGKDASGWPEAELPVDVPRLASLSAAMVSRSLRAFVEADESLARTVLELDDEVDDLNRAAFRNLMQSIQERPSSTRINSPCRCSQQRSGCVPWLRQCGDDRDPTRPCRSLPERPDWRR